MSVQRGYDGRYQYDQDDYRHAEIPDELKDTRACLRCSLIKTVEQFINSGCENCEFLAMEADRDRVLECTTAYFEGVIGMVEPKGSWVAKWQRIDLHIPGMYAIEVLGELPDDAIEYCENNHVPYKAKATK